ncbi:aminoacyl-tRNA hydrolase [Phycisphaeraceae bacterium D3-23]
MKLIVGLGNPGPEYAKTRHNVGFMLVDRLATRHNLTGAKHKFHSGVLDGEIFCGPDGTMSPHRCLLMQPMTYMNRSGLAVAEAVRFYKLEPTTDVLVLVDDIALDCGVIRLRAGGSSGGHNGLTDIERALGTRDYPRLRIGVDPKGRVPQKDYVLGRFTPEQWDRTDPALDRGVKCIEMWLSEGLEKAASLFNAKAAEG